ASSLPHDDRRHSLHVD
ncbi:hypothetical protein BN1708_018869, partial [Verticillium longisporum]